MLAYLEIKKGSRSSNKILNEFLPILGIILIAIYIVSFDDKNVAPSIKTLIPIIGTCLFIWFGRKETLLGIALYSLYGFHHFEFLRKRLICPAIFGPIPSTSRKLSTVAFLSLSILPKCLSKAFLLVSPKPGRSSRMDSLIRLLLSSALNWLAKR